MFHHNKAKENLSPSPRDEVKKLPPSLFFEELGKRVWRTGRGKMDVETEEQMLRVKEGEVASLAVNVAQDKFPFCLVWTPIPVLTWVLPFVGHMGIADSKGVTHDFAGPYYVSKGDLAFGRTTRYIQLDPARATALGGTAQDRARGWDAAVVRADVCYEHKMHNLCFQNCHSHVATVLDEVAYANFQHWNMVILAMYMFVGGRFVSLSSAACSMLPSLVLWGAIAALLSFT